MRCSSGCVLLVSIFGVNLVDLDLWYFKDKQMIFTLQGKIELLVKRRTSGWTEDIQKRLLTSAFKTAIAFYDCTRPKT